MERDKSIKLNLCINVPKVYNEHLKKILAILSEEELGEYFMRFLIRHTLNELANGEDYLEKYCHKIIKQIVNELAKNNAEIEKSVIEKLLSSDKFFENLYDEV